MPGYEMTYLIKRIACHDDETAFKELFNFYYDRLLAYSEAYLHCRQQAEEVVEDVFVNIWEGRQKLQTVSNIQFYLYRSVKNRTLNALARTKRLTQLPVEDISFSLLVTNDNPEEVMIAAEIEQDIQMALNGLSPKCRLAFHLVKEKGLKYKEAAILMGLSVKSVEVYISQALTILAESCRIHIANGDKRLQRRKK
jgi:RNA polymerase sigma-70 factor (family 1)